MLINDSISIWKGRSFLCCLMDILEGLRMLLLDFPISYEKRQLLDWIQDMIESFSMHLKGRYVWCCLKSMS